MELFDKKYLYVEWDDFLKGKEVIYGDEIYQIKNCISNGVKAIVTDKSSNECMPFLVCHMGGCYTKRRFVYYDPLFDFKKAFNEGKKVQVRVANTSPWHDIDATHKFDESLLYRVVEEDAKPKTERLTKRQLSRWLAQGNGEFMFVGYHITKGISFVYRPDEENATVTNEVLVRKWTDTEWHEPTVEYCFPEQGEKNG